MSLTITKMSEPEPWNGKMGLMYQSNIELSDGTKGQVNMKKPDRWSVGDEVVVTSNKETNYGNKLKIERPEGSFTARSSGSKDSPSTRARIDSCWAIGVAAKLANVNPEIDDWQRELYDISKGLLVVRDQIVKEIEAAQNQSA